MSRPLIPSRRQYFDDTPLSDNLDFRSLPFLLQCIGNWMETEGIQDPEFDGLLIERTFPNPDSDECRYAATLYYRKEGDSL